MKKRLWKFPLFVAVFGLLMLVRVDSTMAQATTVTTETSEEIATTIEGCPLGDPIQLTGKMLITTHVTITDKGRYHVQMRTRYEGLTATDLTTGEHYVVHESENYEQNANAFFGFAPFEFTLLQNIKLIKQGEAQGAGRADDDLMFRVLSHVTNNADGQTTGFSFKGEAICK